METPCQFVVSIDTEEDNQWKWKPPAPFTFENIYQLDRFQVFCEGEGLLPTYLVTSAVVADVRSASVLRGFSAAHCEIGAHMHPWSNPPYYEAVEGELSLRRQLFPSQLTPEQFTTKLDQLTNDLERAVGTRPVTFRAGKWGWADWMAPILAAAGYTIDSSVSPTVNWQTRVPKESALGVPDFSSAPLLPYQFPNTQLYEIPMTVVYRGPLKGRLAAWISHQPRRLPVRLVERFLTRPTWLRIYRSTTWPELQAVVDSVLAAQVPVVQFMIHSSELVPGGSPYAKTEADVDRIYTLLQQLSQYVQKQGATPARLRDVVTNNL